MWVINPVSDGLSLVGERFHGRTVRLGLQSEGRTKLVYGYLYFYFFVKYPGRPVINVALAPGTVFLPYRHSHH